MPTAQQRPSSGRRTRKPSLWAVIPTYNERENILSLVPALLAVRPDLRIVIVDDGSPDGTGRAAAELARRTQRVHLLQRGRRTGYSSAVRQGLRFALDRGADLLLQMDADHSHDPQYVPKLVQLVEAGDDVAIGSRYIPGGGTRNWTFARRLLSCGANVLVRRLLGLPVRDCTGGFRCYRREVVEQSGLLEIATEGYAFLLATLYALHQDGWRLGETPIIFVDREYGSSKLSKRIIAEAAMVAVGLALQRLGILSRR